MIIQLHTKDGVFSVDPDKITEEELSEKFNMTRQTLNATRPRNLESEIDELKARLELLGR